MKARLVMAKICLFETSYFVLLTSKFLNFTRYHFKHPLSKHSQLNFIIRSILNSILISILYFCQEIQYSKNLFTEYFREECHRIILRNVSLWCILCKKGKIKHDLKHLYYWNNTDVFLTRKISVVIRIRLKTLTVILSRVGSSYL